MRGDEERVVRAFCAFLISQGWHVQREVGFCDVVAEKGDRRIFAEAKGQTAEIGLDLDTMFGQLLRRMPPQRPDPITTRFAVVVPREAERAVKRVAPWVLEALTIDLYIVDSDGSVHQPKPLTAASAHLGRATSTSGAAGGDVDVTLGGCWTING